MSKSHNARVTAHERPRRWPAAVVLGLVVAAALIYSISNGLTQLAEAVTGFDALTARARPEPAPPTAIEAPGASAETDGSIASKAVQPAPQNAIAGLAPPAVESSPSVAPSVATAPPPAVYSSQDLEVFRARLEMQLGSEPEALEAVRALFDERDPAVRAENIRLLRDTFGVDNE